jgi:hypothetical protein
MEHFPGVCEYIAPIEKLILLGLSLSFGMGLSLMHEQLTITKLVTDRDHPAVLD